MSGHNRLVDNPPEIVAQMHALLTDARSEVGRAETASAAAQHLPKPCNTILVSDADLDAMKAAFKRRFDEALPRTETLMAVALVGYRMALRALKPAASDVPGDGIAESYGRCATCGEPLAFNNCGCPPISDELVKRLETLADKVERQAECLEGYAEQSGHHAKPVPSVFHLQASHFKTYAREVRAALKLQGVEKGAGHGR